MSDRKNILVMAGKPERIRIVLVAPTHPGNIGASARAMANMGLKSLYLVSPKLYPDREATTRASGADHILEQAVVCDTLDEAIADCTLVVATSARKRTLSWPLLDPKPAMQRLLSESVDHDVALVFGREAKGLSNEDLDRCHYMVSLPVDPQFTSINLASAVMLLSYEIRLQYLACAQNKPAENSVSITPVLMTGNFATNRQLTFLYHRMQTVLINIGFFKHRRPKKLMRKLIRIFVRTRLSEDELNILHGVLSQVELSSTKTENSNSSGLAIDDQDRHIR